MPDATDVITPGLDWETLAHQVQHTAEDHLSRCIAVLDAEALSPTGQSGDWSFALAPYDGCLTCQVRETIHCVLPVLTKAMAAHALTDLAAFLRSEQAPDLSANLAYADWMDTMAAEAVATLPEEHPTGRDHCHDPDGDREPSYEAMVIPFHGR